MKHSENGQRWYKDALMWTSDLSGQYPNTTTGPFDKPLPLIPLIPRLLVQIWSILHVKRPQSPLRQHDTALPIPEVHQMPSTILLETSLSMLTAVASDVDEVNYNNLLRSSSHLWTLSQSTTINRSSNSLAVDRNIASTSARTLAVPFVDRQSYIILQRCVTRSSLLYRRQQQIGLIPSSTS